MQRYFFNRTDGGVSIDREGTELPDLDTARREAIVYAAETLRDQPEWAASGELRVDVVDDDGEILLTIVITARKPMKPPELLK